MNINNAKTNAFHARRTRISKSILGPLGGAFCIPESTMTAVRKKAGASPLTGFHLTQVVKESRPTPRARYGNNVENVPGLGDLGEGKNGMVYLGYWGPSSAGNAMAIKVGDHETVNRESKFLKEFKNVSPHIPALYMHKSASQCKEEANKRGGKNPLMNYLAAGRNEPQSIMYSEYASSGDIPNFFTKFSAYTTADDIKLITFQVLWTLDAMQKKMPSFRHGDMLPQNVMVDVDHHDAGTIRYRGGYTVPNRGFRVMVGDFGLAQGNKDGMKSAGLAHLKDGFGIGPNMMKSYDAHLFLMEFTNFLRDHPKAGELKAWVKTVIPAKYNYSVDMKKFNSEYLVGGRLRHGLGSDIPSISLMLGTSYFAEYKKPKYVSAKEWPRSNSKVKPAPRAALKPKPKAKAIPKVSKKAAPRLQRAQVVKMNNLIRAARDMGFRELTEENKARARALNTLIKNEGSKSPKLRPVGGRRARGARSPVMRTGVDIDKMYNLFSVQESNNRSTINLTKPRKQNVSRATILRRAINKERAAFTAKWHNITRPPASSELAKLFKGAGLKPQGQGKLFNAMKNASKNWKNENDAIKRRKNWLAKEKKKVINSMNNNLVVSKNNLTEFVNLMGGKVNYLSTEQIARLPNPTMKNRKNDNKNEKVEMFRGRVKGPRVNEIFKIAHRAGTTLPKVPPGKSPITFFKKHLKNKTKSELAKYPADDLRVLAEMTLKNAVPEGALKNQVLNALNKARNNPNMLANSARAAARAPARRVPAARAAGGMTNAKMNEALRRLITARELAKARKTRIGSINLNKVKELNKAARSVAENGGKAVRRAPKGTAMSKKNRAAASRARRGVKK